MIERPKILEKRWVRTKGCKNLVKSIKISVTFQKVVESMIIQPKTVQPISVHKSDPLV